MPSSAPVSLRFANSINVLILFFQTQFHLCHYAVCHDEAEFVDAERFVPERWLRTEAPGSGGGFFQHHPYSFIPFGVGVRACVGKRVAEMEMYFALSRVSDVLRLFTKPK